MEKTIRLDGIIGDFGNTSDEFNFRLEELDIQPGDELKVIINSVGGSVIEGWGIYNTLKSLDNKVITRAEGLAASIASLILLAGNTVEMSEIGMLMIHKASNLVGGNSDDLEKEAETLKKIDETLKVVYNARSNENTSEDQINKWLEDETWFTAQEAVDIGFVDEIVNKAAMSIAAIYNPKNKNPMSKIGDLLTTISNQMKGEVTEEVSEVVEATEAVENTEVETTEEEKDDFVTAEEGSKMLDLLNEISRRLEAIENPETSMEDLIEASIRKVAKGIRSTGSAPRANANLSGATESGYNPKYADLKAKLNEIGERTKSKLTL
jgi:ATP-dependent protease ClpP protease subunit